MKIQVGKTYKDGFGREFYIECKAAHPVHTKYPYLGTMRLSGSLNWFSEEGVVFSSVCPSESSLLPNRVKKEGWGYKPSPTHGCTYSCKDRVLAEAVVKEDSRRVLVKTIWYEDEE